MVISQLLSFGRTGEWGAPEALQKPVAWVQLWTWDQIKFWLLFHCPSQESTESLCPTLGCKAFRPTG